MSVPVGPASPPMPESGRPPVRAVSLRRNFSWVLVGNLVASGSKWAVFSVIAKLGTPHMLGQYALALAICQPIFTFAQLHLRVVQATDARRRYSFGDYLGLRLVMTGLAMLVITALAILDDDPQTALVTIVTGLGIAPDVISDVIYGLFQHHERMHNTTVSMASRNILFLIVAAIVLYATHSIVWMAVGSASTSLVVLLLYDIPCAVNLVRSEAVTADGSPSEDAAHCRPRFRIRTLTSLAWHALPLGLTTLLISLNTNISRYFIEGSLGVGMLGMFAATASIVGMGNTLVGALMQAVAPRMSQYYATGNAEAFQRVFRRLLTLTALVSIAMVIGMAVLGRQILTVVYTPEFGQYAHILLWLVASGGLLYVSMCYGTALTTAHNFRPQLALGCIVTFVAFITSWWLVPRYGLQGAGISACAAMLVRLVGFIILQRQFLRHWHTPSEKSNA